MKSTISITELSERLGIKAVTLRKWEKDFNLNIAKNERGNRAYTEEDTKVFEQIVDYKNKGFDILQINKILKRSVNKIKQKEKVTESVSLNKLTENNIKEMFFNEMMDIITEREKILIREFENKIEEIKIDIMEEFIIQQEHIRAENKKIIDYIENIKSEKPKGLFRK